MSVSEPISMVKSDPADLEDRMWDYVKSRGGDKLIRRILIANNGMAATKTDRKSVV